MKDPRDIILRSPVRLAFEEVSSGVWRKELIYPGTFIKKDDNGRVEFRLIVDDKLMSHWESEFDRMKRNGIEVPLAKEHSEDIEDRRGSVVSLKKEFNPERGTNSLYVYAKFRRGSEKLAETAQVSLFSPPDDEDGRGNRYIRPITHVALTDYPLVPGLASWSPAAAASRGGRRKKRRAVVLSEEKSSVTVMDVAEALGVEIKDDDTQDDVLGVIEETFQMLADQVEELGGELPSSLKKKKKKPDDDEADIEVPDELVDDLEDVTISSEELEEIDASIFGSDDDEESQCSTPTSSASRRGAAGSSRNVAASRSLARQLSHARGVIIDGLVKDRKLTPAAASRLKRTYTSQKRSEMIASRGDSADDFEDVIAALSSNKPAFRTGTRTGAQDEGLNSRSEKTPLQRDAEARASRAQGKT